MPKTNTWDTVKTVLRGKLQLYMLMKEDTSQSYDWLIVTYVYNLRNQKKNKLNPKLKKGNEIINVKEVEPLPNSIQKN